MTPLSRRYVRPMVFVLLPVLFPVAIHSYGELKVDDCADADGLFPSSASRSPRTEEAERMRTSFQAFSWAEGSFVDSDQRLEFEFAIIRSYDAKRLYHRPENRFRKGTVASRSIEFVTRGSRATPIHLLRYEQTDPAQIAAYLLVYHSSPVANPYLAQLKAFPLQLIAGERPMTIFLVFGRGPQSTEHALSERAKLWLAEAWDRYNGACSSPT